MILKILLKIWPALTPIAIYFFWVIVKRVLSKLLQKKDYITTDYKDLNKSDSKHNNIPPYSLRNKQFIFVIYLSLIFLIISFLSFALQE
ncbi:MAG: hypothetical protein ACI9IL_000802 [Rickettsiales bacterium]|jgi:hypothetical protein